MRLIPVLFFIYYTIFAFIPPIHAQSWTKEKIDTTLLKEIPQLRRQGKVKEALLLSQEVLNHALDEHYTAGIIGGYTMNSSILFMIGRYRESIEYLDLLEPLLKKTKDEEQITRLHIEYGRNYYLLGFFQEAFVHYQKAKEISASVWENETAKRKLIDFLHASEASAYEEMGDMPSFLHSLKEAYAANPTPIVASRMAKYYTVYVARLDSAAYYLALADSLLQTGRFDKHQEAIVLRNKGRYWTVMKRFNEAITAYTSSLAISKEGNKATDVADTYKLVYEVYAAAGDINNSRLYLNKYTDLNDSIQKEQRQLIEIPVQKIIQRQEEQHRKQQQTLYFIGALLAILIGGVWYYSYRITLQKKIQKEEEAILLRRTVQESSQKLIEKEEETVVLQQKVNNAFEELVKLAKNNDPHFYTRFREVYPLLHQKLLEKNTDMQLSELTLCAYIYLDFTTKEIAEYTFKSIRTVQNRKYSLRKKLNVPTSEDLYAWIKVLDIV